MKLISYAALIGYLSMNKVHNIKMEHIESIEKINGPNDEALQSLEEFGPDDKQLEQLMSDDSGLTLTEKKA